MNGDALVLRPLTGKGAGGEILALWLGAFLVTLLFVPVPILTGSPVAVVIVGTIPIVLGVLGWRSLRSRGIVVTQQEITVRGLLFRKRGQRADAVSVIRAHLIYSCERVVVCDTVFVLGAGGQVVIRISGQQYGREDIDRLVEFLDVPWSGPDLPVTPPQLDATHPGMVPWYEAHPWQFAFAGAAAGVALAVVIAVVLLVTPAP